MLKSFTLSILLMTFPTSSSQLVPPLVQPPPFVAPVPTPALPRPFADVPVVWPIRGQINSGYGKRYSPFSGTSEMHTGLDISGKKGQPVFASADGTVTMAKKLGDYGNLVILRHQDGIETWYGHLSTFNVGVGNIISRGDKLGEVGSTGAATGCHLHFEIRRAGRPIDPTKYVLDTLTDRLMN